jgi:TolB-like protein/DNA-binding winged helix-turn-helix (wHTH) protein/Flp pilus assembly protein TadD
VFEVDLGTGELRKSGRRIRIQEQPFQVLAALLERPGEIVNRDELQKKLWPADTFVDFETGLNRCIKKIREALDDSAETPRFVETIPRRGYRFIAPVSPVIAGVPSDSTPSTVEPEIPEPAKQATRPATRLLAGAAIVLALGTIIGVTANHWLGGPKRPQIKTVAVLPLENLSGDPNDEYFAYGMTDELITQLAKLGPISVISRTSVMQYRHTRKPLSVIAKELHVDAVVEGTVTRSREQVRVTAQLIDANSDRHLWAEEYERPLRDVLTLQSEVAKGIAAHIQTRLTSPQPNSPARQVNPDAYEAYLHGTFARTRMSEESWSKSLEYFRQAIQLDPGYAEAYAGASHTYYVGGILGFQPSRVAYPAAMAAANRALELDPTSAEAYNTLADVKQGYDRDWVAAESEYQHALALNPSHAIAHTGYADLLARTGRYDAAVLEARRARELDPISAQTTAFLGFILYQVRRYDEAIKECQTAVEFDPANPGAHWWLGLAYEQKHQFSDAIAELETSVTLSHSSSVYLGALGQAYALAGKREKAVQILDELKARTKKNDVGAFDVAIVYVGLNDKNSALEWLEKAFTERTMRLEQITEPSFDGLRSHPRFISLEHRIGLKSQ